MSDVQEQDTREPAAERPEMFRREAVEYHAGAQHESALLDLTPDWLRWTYWLLLGACATALVYGFVGKLTEYASGTAVILSDDRIDVNAHVAGTVEDVLVRPGQRVTEGQALVRLYAADEAASLERIDSELEQHLVSVLRDPGDNAARSALASLRAQRAYAVTQIEERTLRAPRAGVVNDIRIRPGQRLNPGDLVLSQTSDDAGFRVLAVVPGQYRPLLRDGMLLRLELQGFSYAYQTVVIESVSDEVVGPAEVQRYLPRSIADAIAPDGPMVFIEARLPDRSFEMGGRALGYYDGMLARAEVAVRSENILITLIPGLRTLMGDHDQGI